MGGSFDGVLMGGTDITVWDSAFAVCDSNQLYPEEFEIVFVSPSEHNALLGQSTLPFPYFHSHFPKPPSLFLSLLPSVPIFAPNLPMKKESFSSSLQ